MKSSSVSKCCKASISVAGSDEGTMFFVCDNCHKSCDPQSNKPKFGKDFFYGKIKSPTYGLSQQIKDMVDEAYNANLDSGEITKAPVGASGVNTGSSKNYKSIIAGKEWSEQLMDFLYPGMERRFAFDEDQVAVNPLKLKQLIGSIYSQAEQRGYERGLIEAHKNDYTPKEIDDLLTRTEQEGYDRAKRELEPKYGGQG